MSEKAREIHNAYCDYQIAKAKSPSRIYSVRDTEKEIRNPHKWII